MNKKLITLWLSLLFVAWIQPDHFPPWVSFHSEVPALFAFAILFLSVCIPKKSVGTLDVPASAIVMCLIVAVVLGQQAVGIGGYSGDTIVVALLLIAAVFAIIAGRMFGIDEYLRGFAWAIVFAGLLSALIAALQSLHPTDTYTFINPMPNWRRPGANLAQPNHLGTLLLWALVSGMYLHATKQISGRLLVVMGSILLMALAMTESRTALLGVLAIAAWSGVYYFRGTPKKRCAMVLGFGGLGASLFVLWPLFIVVFHEGGWATNNGGVNTQPGDRFVVWPQLIGAILERPWFGWGVRGVPHALNAVLDRYEAGAPFTYAHNVFLDLAIGFGMPIALLLVALAFAWCARRITHLRNMSDWYAIALLIPFGLHSMLEFPFAYSYFLLPACFAIGVLDAKRQVTGVRRVPRWVAIAMLAAWAALGSIAVRDYLLAEEDSRIARFEALKIGKTPTTYERPHLLVLNQLDEMNVAIRIVPHPKMTADEIDLLRRATLRYPWPAIQNRYALALALTGDLQEAQRQLKVMRAMYGENMYSAIRVQWETWANDQYPQLQGLALP